jgi:parvulin-like peptidyl-prolyl isomerase
MKVLMLILLACWSCGFVAGAEEKLFDDPIVAKGKGVEVRQSQVDEAWTSFKANRAASGEPVIPGAGPKIRRQIVEKLVSTQLLLSKATAKDREEGKAFADKYIDESKSKARSEAAFNRQLLALGTTYEQYHADVLEQAISKAVIDRELKKKEIVTEEEIRKFYEDNPDLFFDPEQFRVRQILIASREIPSGNPLTPSVLRGKRATAEKALARARKGEDFTKLVKEYSEDPKSKNTGGELSFTKGSGVVPVQFEAAAATLGPNQISDLVQTVFGWHIIKLEERIPGKKADINQVQEKIREAVLQVRVQKKLGQYLDDLKKQAEVRITIQEVEN